MRVRPLFPTFVYDAPLQTRGARALNARLLRECLQLRHDDRAGVAWSKQRYPGGYTSYGSVNRMQLFSPTFAALERRLGARLLQKVAGAPRVAAHHDEAGQVDPNLVGRVALQPDLARPRTSLPVAATD